MNFDGLGLRIVIDWLKFKCWTWENVIDGLKFKWWTWENGKVKDLNKLKFNKIFIFYLWII